MKPPAQFVIAASHPDPLPGDASAGPSRRDVLGWLAMSGLMAACPLSAAAATDAVSADFPFDPAHVSAASLTAWVDTLIPADALSPSASQLGVDRILIGQAVADPGFRRWLDAGLQWLDAEAGPAGPALGHFARLDESARTGLVQRLAAAPLGSTARTLFEQVRFRVMTAYYADPAGRNGLVFDRPPQPIGYPDFAG